MSGANSHREDQIDNAVTVRQLRAARPPSTFESPSSTSVEPRNGTGARVLNHYYLQQGLTQDIADELARFSFLVRHQRSTKPEPLSSQHIEFVLFGTVLVDGRIWGGNYTLGNLDLFTDVPSVNRLEQVQFLSATRTVRIPRGALRSIAVRNLPVVRMIHQRLMNYVQDFENLYGTDVTKPIHRVARLLDHLTYQQDRGAEIVIGALDPNLVIGPTQRDFANALGLGVSTVEKALRDLRSHKILAETTTGGRLNRTYRVLDNVRLRAVGCGANLLKLDMDRT
ncbi:helix-turn-helix domain-containing protein [Streptomyces sp. LaBMicrA B280]|uniref:helix-turn-helix domain-containing protein n=1 Tax=Streptomyces sp. LaBMicrA B280 TaxID=3391001 RepID=UPI003BA6C3B2